MVITDGEQTQAPNTKNLKDVSEPLRKEGVQVLALGIGSGVNPDELRLMVERDEDVLLAKSFDDLLVKVNSLVKSTCDAAGKCALVCDWLKNQWQLACTRFPALGAGYMYLLRDLIGSLPNLCLL